MRTENVLRHLIPGSRAVRSSGKLRIGFESRESGRSLPKQPDIWAQYKRLTSLPQTCSTPVPSVEGGTKRLDSSCWRSKVTGCICFHHSNHCIATKELSFWNIDSEACSIPHHVIQRWPLLSFCFSFETTNSVESKRWPLQNFASVLNGWFGRKASESRPPTLCAMQTTRYVDHSLRFAQRG